VRCDRCTATRFSGSRDVKIGRLGLGHRHPLQVSQRSIDAHRKQPLDNHGREKTRRKARNWPNWNVICASHGGCSSRKRAREMGLLSTASSPRERVDGLDGGEHRIQTHGSCLMLASATGLLTALVTTRQAGTCLQKGACLRAFCAIQSRSHAGSITIDAEPTATERRGRKVREPSNLPYQ
jgi:hypothetical protein